MPMNFLREFPQQLVQNRKELWKDRVDVKTFNLIVETCSEVSKNDIHQILSPFDVEVDKGNVKKETVDILQNVKPINIFDFHQVSYGLDCFSQYIRVVVLLNALLQQKGEIAQVVVFTITVNKVIIYQVSINVKDIDFVIILHREILQEILHILKQANFFTIFQDLFVLSCSDVADGDQTPIPHQLLRILSHFILVKVFHTNLQASFCQLIELNGSFAKDHCQALNEQYYHSFCQGVILIKLYQVQNHFGQNYFILVNS